MKKIIIYLFLICLISSCGKEEIKQRHGEGWASFSDIKLEFVDVEFHEPNIDTINLELTHYAIDRGIIYNISILNLPLTSDSVNLVYYDGSPAKTNLPIVFYYIKPSEDTLGEHYVIDSLDNSYLILESVSKTRISGRFNLNFILSDQSLLPKHATYIPDRFSVTEGRFNAKIK